VLREGRSAQQALAAAEAAAEKAVSRRAGAEQGRGRDSMSGSRVCAGLCARVGGSQAISMHLMTDLTLSLPPLASQVLKT
jgi:hypothetical protein